MASKNPSSTQELSKGSGRYGRFLALGLCSVLLCGCGAGKDENSPDMGAVAPKPNFNAAANAPGGGGQGAKPGADAQAMGASKKGR